MADAKTLAAEAKLWISQVVIAAHRRSPAQTKVAVEGLEAFIDQLAALASQAGPVEAEYWQWRRKGTPWSLEKTFNSEPAVTTEDSEKRGLYTWDAVTASHHAGFEAAMASMRAQHDTASATAKAEAHCAWKNCPHGAECVHAKPPTATPAGDTQAASSTELPSKYDGAWSVFNSGGACIIENVAFDIAADFMTADRFARGWNMVSCINVTSMDQLVALSTASAAPAEPSFLSAAEQVVRADRDQALTQQHIDYLDAQCKVARAAPSDAGKVPEPRDPRMRPFDQHGPLPGMIAAFEASFGQSWTDKDWRDEASTWARAWKSALASRSAQAMQADAGLTDQQRAVLQFLYGSGLLRGAGFGTNPEGEKAPFWWRRELLAAFPDLGSQPQAGAMLGGVTHG